MVPWNEGKRVVRSWSDSSATTGDRYHQTEDGRVWIQPLRMPDYSNATCPPIRGTIFNNRIF